MVCIEHPIIQAKIAPIIGVRLPVMSRTLYIASPARHENTRKKSLPTTRVMGRDLRKETYLLRLTQALLHIFNGRQQSVLGVRKAHLRREGDAQSVQRARSMLVGVERL